MKQLIFEGLGIMYLLSVIVMLRTLERCLNGISNGFQRRVPQVELVCHFR